MDYAYANIVNMKSDNGVVQSFVTNPLFRFIKFYADFDSPELDESLPTLYVGYKQAKTRFKLDVLNPKLSALSWWCPSPEEDAMRFLKGFQSFLTLIAPSLVESLVIEQTDPIFGPAKSSKELLNLLRGQKLEVSYLRSGIFHIYTSEEKVLVFSTHLYAGLAGTDEEKLRLYIKESSTHYYDDANNAIFHFIRNCFDFQATEVPNYIPYLIWLKVKGKPVSQNKLQQVVTINP